MQPSPSAETSRPWVPKVLLSIDYLLIGGDLPFDVGQVPLHLRQLGPHRLPVLLETLSPLVRASTALVRPVSREAVSDSILRG
jgi:hypothetical protein